VSRFNADCLTTCLTGIHIWAGDRLADTVVKSGLIVWFTDRSSWSETSITWYGVRTGSIQLSQVGVYEPLYFRLGGLVRRILDRGRSAEASTIRINRITSSGTESGLVASASAYSS